MKLAKVYRNGELKLAVPAEIRNGILRSGKNILINNDLIPAGKRDAVATEIKAGRITPEIEAMGMRIGDNGNGLVVRWEADELAKAGADYAALPAVVRASREERAAISRLYLRAEQALYKDEDDCNIIRGHQLLAEAKARLAAWREKYPDEAKKENARKLVDAAEKKESLARGALTYDCDGSLSAEDQQSRHDKLIAEAKELRESATKTLEDNHG